MMLTVTITGARAAAAALGAYGEQTQRAVNAALDASALRIEGGAKRLAPVDTGRLRSSYAVWTPAVGVRAIGSDVAYAPYVEWGSRRRPARPHLGVAYADEVPAFMRRLRVALRNV